MCEEWREEVAIGGRRQSVALGLAGGKASLLAERGGEVAVTKAVPLARIRPTGQRQSVAFSQDKNIGRHQSGALGLKGRQRQSAAFDWMRAGSLRQSVALSSERV